MACRDNLELYLQQRDVPYEIQHHPLAFTAQQVAAADHLSGKMLAKVVMVFADDDLTMLVLPGHCHVDLEAARAALGTRDVRLAHEREFAHAFPDCQPGTMPPFGSVYGIPVYVDEALADNERIVFQIGTHTETMSLSYRDFTRLVRPTMARLGHVSRNVRRAS